ncbi:response regulator transcription factor [Mesorhizobium australicum]|uniref:response regulator transcription factor n=1 Tax=Mesorhizobium australicum TaxID=536018 RepID=UPI00333D0593
MPDPAISKPALISIVDDDQPFRDSMRRLITLLGYNVEAFPSAADFLASRVLAETACLVADIHMPGMTGIELYRHLVKVRCALPTILVTAYPDEAAKKQAMKDGVVCYLGKPMDDGELEHCLSLALSAKPLGEYS